jgi:hypothetical protein
MRLEGMYPLRNIQQPEFIRAKLKLIFTIYWQMNYFNKQLRIKWGKQF